MVRRRDDGTGATIKDLTYAGRTVTLCVSDKGIFYTLVGEERIEAKSLDSLTDKAKRAIDQLGKIAIPITLMSTRYSDEKPTFEDVVLVGLSGRRGGNARIQTAGGELRTVNYSETLCTLLSKVDKERLVAAWRAMKRTEAEYNTLHEAAQRNPGDLFKQAAESLDDTAAAVKDIEETCKEGT